MKKSFMIFMLSCTFLGTAQADRAADYYDEIDKWQLTYPIIGTLKKEKLFYDTSEKVLVSYPTATPEAVFKKVIGNIIPTFIKQTDLETHAGINYFNLVERLDPVYRDLCNIPAIQVMLPTTNGNMYEVKNIFKKTQVIPIK